MNIRDYRLSSIKISNPIIMDYKIANDLFLYALSNSYFRNNLIICDDYRYIVDKNYPQELVYFKVNVVRYKLNKGSIIEIVNSLNISNKEIKIMINKIDVDDYENYHVTLSFYDNFNNSITNVRYIFFTNYIAKSGLRDFKWIALPILKTKVYVGLECKELCLARNLTSLLYENSFYLDDLVEKRINYILMMHFSINQTKKSFDLEIRYHNYDKKIFFNELIDCVNFSSLKNKDKVFELIERVKSLS